MAHKTVLWSLVVLSAACVPRDERQSSPAASARARAALSAHVSTGVHASAVAPPAGRTITWVGGRPKLPKWKTPAERESERRAATAHASGIVVADQYDDYRNLHIGSFYITKSPATASRVVAEFEPSQAYLVTWIPGWGYDAFYTAIVTSVWGKVPVLIAHQLAAEKTSISSKLTAAGIPAADLSDPTKVIWWQHAVDSVWARDFGPVNIVNTSGAAKLSFVDFRYYHDRVHDDEIPSALAAAWGINVFRPDLDLEGGNFMSTSDGLCAATKGVLYYNTQFTQSAVEDIFNKYMGCKKSIFPEPLAGEDTSHIDMFSKFGADTKVLVGEYTSTQDATNKAILDANATLFASTPNGSGAAVTVTRIPMPNKGSSGGYTVWRTYTNSQALASTTTKHILIPTYSDETSKEAAALAAYTTVFSGWTQVKIDSKGIIPDGGAIHCVIVQLAAGAHSKMETDPTDLCGATKLECSVVTCGNVTYDGCCDGTVLKYCDSGKLVTYDCASQPQCGWSSQYGGYDCGTSGGSDPSGVHPKSCGVTVADSGPKLDVNKVDAGKPMPDTGGGCGQISVEGCCDGQTLKFCEDGQLMMGSCASDPQCGWDAQNGWYDCGTSGGADPSGKNPKACPGSVVTDGGPQADQPSSSCGTVTDVGCCDGTILKYCENGQLQSGDCAGSPSCGWDSQNGWYDCGTSGGADPSGKHPKACTSTPPTPDKGPTPAADVFVPKADQSVAPPADQSGPAGDQKVVTKKDGGNKNEGGGGCSCGVGGESAPAAMPLLLLAIGVLILRRRDG